MEKKNSGIYAPGELQRVRQKLGVTDNAEAKRMMQVLGGEVGTERSVEPEQAKGGRKSKGDPLEGLTGGKKRRRIDIAGGPEDDDRSVTRKPKIMQYPGDDPSVPAKLSYGERVKIDQFAGQVMFEIKSSMQVLVSIFSFFKEPVDYVSPRFVTLRMNEYFGKIEKLVMMVRNLFPKNNTKRNHQLKRASPFVYKILEVLRDWNIEKLAKDIAALQAHPRTVKVTDFSDLMREIYKPVFILDDLNVESLKTAFKLVYKVLYIESPMDAKEKYQDIIRNIISSLIDIRRNVCFRLYPLLMKMISDRYLPYERFFIERRRRYMAFLNATEASQLKASDLSPQQIDSMDVETLQKNLEQEEAGAPEETEEVKDGEEAPKEKEEDPEDPKVIERKEKEESEKAEQKALERGLTTLESLFPKANWDKLAEYPDLYIYFANIYNLKHGYELISPTDPLQQIAVLMNIFDDLAIAMRYVTFSIIPGQDGSQMNLRDEMSELMNNWRTYIEDSFSKDYLSRLSEYCRILENSEESRTSPYARKILNECNWVKRLYFLPYYKFESAGPPPFTKQDVIPIYSVIRKMRKNLTSVAMGIEQGIRAGGASARAPCGGINNPWERYNFQVPNPTSKRLDMMLPPERRMNASIIFFSLSVVTVLDYIVNNENSWAYGSRPGPLFRSVKNEGITPLFGVDEKLDADKIFKESLKKNQ